MIRLDSEYGEPWGSVHAVPYTLICLLYTFINTVEFPGVWSQKEKAFCLLRSLFNLWNWGIWSSKMLTHFCQTVWHHILEVLFQFTHIFCVDSQRLFSLYCSGTGDYKSNNITGLAARFQHGVGGNSTIRPIEKMRCTTSKVQVVLTNVVMSNIFGYGLL
jgi:hypothetical protein